MAEGARRGWMWALIVVGVIALALAAYLVVTGLLARSAAEELRASIARAEQAASSADVAGSVDAVEQAGRSAASLLSLTSGPVWGAVQAIPVAGPQVRAARDLAATVDEVVAAGQPLLDLARDASDTGLRTPDGAIDLEALTRAGPALTATAQAMRAGSARLAATPASTSDIDSAVADARELLEPLAARLDDAAEAAELLPGLLGADGPRTWAVLLQNAAEMRGSGGLLGAYALVTVDDGRITLDEAAARKDGLDGQRIPVEEVADPEQLALWGAANLEDWASYNLSVDFPFVAELTAAGMDARGTPVDGVAAVDASIVAAVLAGTDSVTAGPLSINAGNAEDVFTRDIYALLPDVEEKDAATVALLQATLEAALTRPLDLARMLTALTDPVSGGHLRLWSADPAEQAWLRTTPLGGQLSGEPGPHVSVGLNNTAGSKLDRYVTLTADYRVGTCPSEPMATSRLTLDLVNQAPDSLPDYVTVRLDDTAAPVGSTSLRLSVYAPAGSFVDAATLEGRPIDVMIGQERGRPVWSFDLELPRGEPRALAVDFIEPVPGIATPTLALPPLVEGAEGVTSIEALPEGECPAQE